jgi:hypothetical protein
MYPNNPPLANFLYKKSDRLEGDFCMTNDWDESSLSPHKIKSWPRFVGQLLFWRMRIRAIIAFPS